MTEFDYTILLNTFFALILGAGAAVAYSFKLRDDNAAKDVSYQKALSQIDSIISIKDNIDDQAFLKKALTELGQVYGASNYWINYSHNPTIVLDNECTSLELDDQDLINNVVSQQSPFSSISNTSRSPLLSIPVIDEAKAMIIVTLELNEHPSDDDIKTATYLVNAIWQGMRKKHRIKTIYHHDFFLRAATENGNVGLFDWNVETNEVYFSKVWKKQLGYSGSEISNSFSEWERRLHPEDKKMAEALIQECLSSCSAEFRLEHRLQHKDGSYVWIRAQATIFYNHNNQAERVLGAHIDISEQKATEHLLLTERDHAQALATRNDTILGTMSDGIVVLDADGNQVFANQSALNMLGYSKDELIGLNAHNTWHYSKPDGSPLTVDDCQIHSVLKTSLPYEGKDWFIQSNGEFLPVFTKTSPIVINGGTKGSVVSFYDIRKQLEDERQIKLSAAVYENTAEGIMITDENNTIVSVNQAFQKITGYSSEEVIGHKPNILASGKTPKSVYLDMWKSINSYGVWRGEVVNQNKNGAIFTEMLSITTLKDDFGKRFYVGVLNDISHIKQTQDQLTRLANHDRLTGIPNKFFFESVVNHLLAKDQRLHKKSALLYMDMDRFKNINDSMGHDYGDKLIIECAKRLNSIVREMDYCARLGGDEFAVFVEDYDTEEEIYALAKRLIRNISEPYNLNGCTAYIGMSIGVAFYPKDGKHLEELKRAADVALYQSKSDGRGVYRTYSEEMSDMAKERQELENLLRKAMSNNELELHYQPQVNLKTGQRVGYEALARWNHHEKGYISPASFIPLAEETGLITTLGKWVIEESSKQIRKWLDQGYDPGYVAVNISALQLVRSDLVAEVSFAVQNSGIPASSLELEITESFLIHEPEKAAKVLNELKGLGVRISIDDFGTGFSSLGYIKDLPCDCIKVDQSFVKDIEQDSSNRSLVAAIIAMSKGLGLEVIAEGVEKKEHEEILIELGCSIGQGWRYGKPLPADRVDIDKKNNCMN